VTGPSIEQGLPRNDMQLCNQFAAILLQESVRMRACTSMPGWFREGSDGNDVDVERSARRMRMRCA